VTGEARALAFPGRGLAGAAVEIDSLSVERGGRVVLREVASAVAAGRVTGLFGPSGSGKSTLIRAIAGVQSRVRGTLTVFGEPPGSPAAHHAIGYKTQTLSLYQDLSVAGNVRYFAAVRGGGDVGAAIARVDLEDHARQLVRNMSGGQQARASLAVALVGDPPLLLLDEPTVGLDPLLRRDLWRSFRHLAAAGATLLVSSHVLDEARHCDDLMLLRDGRVVAQLPPSALVRRTGTDDLDEAFVRLIERSAE
jgi:ABC-2 type transport system ATP-binding protein